MSVDSLFAKGGGVAARGELAEAGFTRGRLRGAVARGAFQLPFPGVVVNHGGPLGADQLMRCALVYGGALSVLSHHTAAEIHGLSKHSSPANLALTVPNGDHRQSVAGLDIHQTTRPVSAWYAPGLRYTHPARTVVDMALQMGSLDDVVAIVAGAVQSQQTTLRLIRHEAQRVPRRGSRLLRIALAEVGTGVRSAGEGLFLRLVRQAKLPEPELNAPVRTAAGTLYLDALWRRQRVAVEIDGRGYHLGAAAWARDLARQNRIMALGITLLRFPVRRLHTDPGGAIDELRALVLPR